MATTEMEMEDEIVSSFPASAAFSVRRLDMETSSALRKGQVISKVSDVLRELVDNSVDAGSPTIQVYLQKFGLDKIEVRDTGQGIPSSDLKNAVTGGYTSKLENVQHPSCESSYGFRGEALSSICSVAFVSVITKTAEEPQATKYVLDRSGSIVSESRVAYGKGTVVTVEKIFSNYPVRRQWMQDKSKCAAELKEMEAYLKAVGIANSQIHMSFYHDGNLIWTKAAVPTIDQALITVLGHKLAKNLVKCGPVNIEVNEGERRQRTLEVFLLKKPIDMKSMSFTYNRFTIILVNRKRVYVREFEKLIQKYVAAVVEKPAPADIRRFPVSVLNMRLPSDEVDFNRDIDKSKLFFVHKEEIAEKLEELLSNFYEVDLRRLGEQKGLLPETASKNPEIDDCIILQNAIPDKFSVQEVKETSPVVPEPAESQKRKEAILAFLDKIPSACGANFSQSPVKECPVNFNFPKSNLASNDLNGHISENRHKANEDYSSISIELTNHHHHKGADTSNFNINLEDFNWTQTQGVKSNAEADKVEVSINLKEWVHGRMTDDRGALIENVNVINRPPPIQATRGQPTVDNDSSIHWTHTSFNNKPIISPRDSSLTPGFRASSPSEILIDVPECSAPKRPRRAEDDPFLTSGKPSGGISFSSPKQITLDSYKNWQHPGNRLTQSQSFVGPNTPTGVRFPLSQSLPSKASTPTRSVKSILGTTKRIEKSNGVPSKSIKEYWNNPPASCDNRINSSTTLSSLRKNVNLQQSMASSQSSSQGLPSSKLIGEILGTELYAAQVNEFVGVFSPMQMLHKYPSMKYDLKVSFDKLTVSSPESPITKYAVSKTSVQSLFGEFLNLGGISSDGFSKIFHILHDLKNVQVDFLDSPLE